MNFMAQILIFMRELLHDILKINSQPLVDVIRNQLIGKRKVESLNHGKK